jgi:Ca2+-binding RTX toxin-like protein
MANFTWDQIANQLTNGYWAANSELPRSFDVSGDRTLTYDFSRLSTSAQLIGTQALTVWSAVTGITFQSVGAAAASVTETSDAGLLGATSYLVSTNTEISGGISSATDVDHYRVTLTAGQTYLIALSNYPGGTLGDAVLELLDSSGNVLTSSDSPDVNSGEYVSYTATTTGTYYLSASGFEGATGTYGLSIQQTADITFNDMDQTGAYSNSDITGNTIDRSYINIADNWDTLDVNGYMLQTYIHELGHALGLGHAGNYNGTATWGVDNLYGNDSWSATVMSYFSQDENLNDPAGFANLQTFMPADVIAIQNLYGAGPAGFSSGDTVWGAGGNVVLGTFQQTLDRAVANDLSDAFLYNGTAIAFTIYDTGGTDTIDTSLSTALDQTINLGELTFSNLFGFNGNVVIARGTVIENAIGNLGRDVITGNSFGNRIEGGGGVDVIDGAGGDDIIEGGQGADTLAGGSHTLIGDTVSYTLSAAGVIVNLATQTASLGDAQGDKLSGFENATGSAQADTLTGSTGANILKGGAGNDTLLGGAGGDNMDGGDGTGDTVSYAGSTSVNINLLSNTATGGHAAGDVILGFENVTGSSQSDTIAGDANANVLNGALGTGDLLTYANSNAFVNVNLTTNVVSGGFADGDTISGFERVIGSNFDDFLAGTVFANTLAGGSGNDTIYGDAGADNLTGGNGFDTLDYTSSSAGVTINLLTNTASGGNAQGDLIGTFERVNGSAGGVDVLTGNAAVNILRGNGGNDIIEGGAGGDTLDGGVGSADTLVYTSSNAAVFVNIGLNTATGGHAQGDLISGFERLTGSAFDDTLTGTTAANLLKGGLGNDTITGGAGADTFVFDTSIGATNIDNITDFSVPLDTIQLDNLIFSTLIDGILDATLFGFAATTDMTDRVIYDQATGALFYDTNGSDAGGSTQIASLTTGLAMTAADFFVI